MSSRARFRDHAGLEPIVELHLAVLHVVLEGTLAAVESGSSTIRARARSWVVTSPMAPFEPGFHYGFRSNQAVVEFVLREVSHPAGRGGVDPVLDPHNLPQPEHFAESGNSALQGIHGPDGRPDLQGEILSDSAQTGAPASARIAFVPTVRRSVLFPDILEPLTIQTEADPPSVTSLATASNPAGAGVSALFPQKQHRLR